YSVLVFGAWALVHRSAPRERGVVTREQRREMVTYVMLASIGGVGSAGLLPALPLLAEVYTTRTEGASFVTAVALAAPLYFLPRALGMALFPAMAHAHGAGELDVVRRHADISTRALFVLLAPLFVLAVCLARPVLAVIYGLDFTPGAKVLQ